MGEEGINDTHDLFTALATEVCCNFIIEITKRNYSKRNHAYDWNSDCFTIVPQQIQLSMQPNHNTKLGAPNRTQHIPLDLRY